MDNIANDPERDSILENALVSATEKILTPSITIRKIALPEEILFRRAGVKILSPDFLGFVAEYATAARAVADAGEKISAKQQKDFLKLHERFSAAEEELLRAAFICSARQESVRALIEQGGLSFDDAFFAWLGLLPTEKKNDAIAFVISSALEIAAASFKTVADGERAAESKNAQTPPPPHS